MLGLDGSEGQGQQYDVWLEEVGGPFSCCSAAEVADPIGTAKDQAPRSASAWNKAFYR